MKEGLLQLLKLQEVDKKLFSLEEAKEEYPAEINQRRSNLAEERSDLTKLEAASEKSAKDQRHHEREVDSGKASLREREERFSAVTNNKEYDSLQLEIEICKKAIAEHETKLLKALEEQERIQAKIAPKQEAFEEIRVVEQERIDELEGLLSTMQEQIAEVKESREAVAKNIDAQLLQLYEQKKGRRGIRIAAVRRKACGACYHQMPAQMLNEVRAGDRVISCENCGTIMVWDEQSV